MHLTRLDFSGWKVGRLCFSLWLFVLSLFFLSSPESCTAVPLSPIFANVDPTPLGFPGGWAGKECPQCSRPGFDSWVGKIPWRREQLPNPVVSPGKFQGVAKSSILENYLPIHFQIFTQHCLKTKGGGEKPFQAPGWWSDSAQNKTKQNKPVRDKA